MTFLDVLWVSSTYPFTQSVILSRKKCLLLSEFDLILDLGVTFTQVTSTVLLSTTALLFWYKGTILHPIWELAPIIRYQLQIKCQMTTTYCESIACFVEEKNLMHFILFDILINFPTCRFMLMDILRRFPFCVKASAKPISLTNFTKASASI